MSADITKSFNGKKYKFHLESDNEVPLTGRKGGVRSMDAGRIRSDAFAN
jgi:hypothetical protein